MQHVRFLIVCAAVLAATPLYAQQAEDSVVSEESVLAAPIIFSSTYPDQSAWYQATTSLFSWYVPDSTDAIWFDWSADTPKEPNRKLASNFEQITFLPSEIPEGVVYANVQFEEGSALSPVSSWKMQIDNTPPTDFAPTVHVIDADQVKLTVKVSDELSGIEKYEVIRDGEVIKTIPAGADISHIEAQGGDVLTVRVYDRAGNTTDASVTVQGDARDEGVATTMIGISPSAETAALQILVGLLTVVCLSLFMYVIFLRQRYYSQEKHSRAHLEEIQHHIRKIFAALRDEIHDQIISITVRKKLTAREREVVQSLTEALTVSETLLEKELRDDE